VLEKLWTSEDRVRLGGRVLQDPGAFSDPKPLQRPWPTIMNAGTSPAGRAFAVTRHSDLIFAGLTSLETAQAQIDEIKDLARAQGRSDFRIFGRAHIVIGDTTEQAQQEFERIHWELADIAAARNVTHVNAQNSQSTPFADLQQKVLLQGMIAGFWALPLVGTVDQVVKKLLDLQAGGLDGIALSWPRYDEGLAQLEELILPRLVEAGVRRPIPARAPAAV
jgi:FMNH2-dependent dimethyl sulfone monooxygenase